MKKIVKLLLSIFLFINIFLVVSHYEIEHDHENHHIYAYYNAGDIYGNCPICSTALTPIYNTVIVIDAIYIDCTSKGNIYVQCQIAGCSHFDSFVSDPMGHEWDVIVNKKPTCTENGQQTKTCGRCSEVKKETLSSLGHNYVEKIIKEATCEEEGLKETKCSRCNDKKETTLNALGHNYLEKITKNPTCEQTGLKTSTCQRCNDKKTITLKAIGHNFIYEEIEATCKEDGHKTGICKRCGDKDETIYPALGHDMSEFMIIKEATCIEDGLKEAKCQRCDEIKQEKINKLEHNFPEEWTIIKKASYFHEGLKNKICYRCNEKIEEIIPKNDATALILGGIGIFSLSLGLIYFLYKKGIIFSSKKVIEEVTKKGLKGLKPKVEDKTIVLYTKEEKIIELLNDKHYLDIKICKLNEIKDAVIENEPDLALITIYNVNQLNKIIKLNKEELKDYKLALIVDKDVIKKKKIRLNKLVEEERIINYISLNKNEYHILTKLILPILKPNFNSDESLENIAGIADILGIPGISNVLNTFVLGRDIKVTLEEGELGVVEKATIISDIAYILGLDKIGDVVNLVDDIDKIKKALRKKAGANKSKKGLKAAKDIVEVVSDIVE